MSWQAGLGKPFLAALSLLISLTLWLVVQSEIQPDSPEFRGVPLDMSRAGLPDGLVVVGADKAPLTVDLKATGPADQVSRIKAEDLKPYVNLSGVGPISKAFTVRLDRAAKDKERGIEWTLGNKTLKIEQVIHKEFNVGTPVATGVLRDPNLFVVTFSVEPPQVVLSGPESLIKEAMIVRVFYDLEKIGSGIAQTPDVEVLDADRRAISGLTVEPSKVTVRPVLGAANQHRILFVTPTFEGTQPEFGYKVTKVSVTPAQVQFSGSSEMLARLRATTVDTMKIDLTGLTSSTTRTVDLDLSQFRSLKSNTTSVRVHVQIDPITAVPPLKPLGP